MKAILAAILLAAPAIAGNTAQDMIARTLYFEDALHPSTPADAMWHRAAKRAGERFVTLSWDKRAAVLCDTALKSKVFSALNSGKVLTLPIKRDQASQTAWRRCNAIARDMITGTYRPSTQADHYHRDDVRPAWTDGMRYLGQVGRHMLWRSRRG